MGSNMNNKFLEIIHEGNYQEAKKLLSNKSNEEIYQFLIDQAIETESISIYTFVCFLLSEQESTELHYCAAGILDHGLCYIKGATSASLFHARRAAKLSPDDISCQRELLFYFGMPDHVMSEQEAEIIAKTVLEKNPDDAKATQVIKMIKKLD